MKSNLTREEALELLKTYNKEPSHTRSSTARRRRNFSEKEEWGRT